MHLAIIVITDELVHTALHGRGVHLFRWTEHDDKTRALNERKGCTETPCSALCLVGIYTNAKRLQILFTKIQKNARKWYHITSRTLSYYPLTQKAGTLTTWIFLRQETVIPEQWKPTFRIQKPPLIGLTIILKKSSQCQAQSRSAGR